MSEKVRFKTVSLKKSEEYEYLKDLMQKSDLVKYFSRVVTHTFVPETLERDTMYISCDHTFHQMCVDVVRDITMDVPKIPALFYSFFDSNVTEKHEVAVIQYNLNGFPVAYYHPTLNVMFTTDWIHFQESVEIANSLWNAIKIDFKAQFDRPIPKLTIGTDPEMEVVREGCVVLAKEHLKREDATTKARLGVDGCGQQLEVRPNASEVESEVVKDTAKIFKEYYKKYGYDLCVNGDNYPLGFHIHVGGFGEPLSPPRELARLYDEFLYYPTEKLNGKARGSYAGPSHFEGKPYGFEYRSLPGALMAKPSIAALCFKAMKNLTIYYMVNQEIEYDGPPTNDDYVRMCGWTHKEYDEFFAFVKGYKKEENANILKNWLNLARIKAPMYNKLFFKDQWNSAVQQALETAILRFMASEHIDFRVTIFGYSEQRDWCASIPIKGIGALKIQTDISGGGFIDKNVRELKIGLPYQFRTEPSNLLIHKENTLKAIRNEILRAKTILSPNLDKDHEATPVVAARGL